jgi:steroid 5-alpha reductase family enzyme
MSSHISLRDEDCSQQIASLSLVRCAIWGSLLHLALLSLPLWITGRANAAAETLYVFLTLATVFFLADLSRMLHAQPDEFRSPKPGQRLSQRLCLLTGLVMLLIFWTALLDHTHLWQSLPRRLNPGESGYGPRLLVNLHVAGGFLMLLGSTLRWLAIRTLGQFFVSDNTICESQPLVQRGVYRYMRHPSETGLLAVVLGACLLLSSPLGLLIWSCLLLPLVLLRLNLEERRLRTAFGKEFDHYAGRVKRLVPFIY